MARESCNQLDGSEMYLGCDIRFLLGEVLQNHRPELGVSPPGGVTEAQTGINQAAIVLSIHVHLSTASVQCASLVEHAEAVPEIPAGKHD